MCELNCAGCADLHGNKSRTFPIAAVRGTGALTAIRLCRTYFSAMYFICLFQLFGGLPQLAVMVQNRTVWFKHRDMNLYTATAFAWSSAIVQLPLSIIEALLFAILYYFMIGFFHRCGFSSTVHVHLDDTTTNALAFRLRQVHQH